MSVILCVCAGQSDCEQCDSSCWTCSGNGKEQCDSCQDGKWTSVVSSVYIFVSMYVQKDIMNVLSNLYVDSWNLHACLCVYTGMFLTNSQMCVSICPHETHPNQTSGRCEDCSAGCLTCRDAHHCLKCKDGGSLYLLDGKCVAECKRWKMFFQNT